MSALLYVCLALCLPCSISALLYVCLALCLPCSMSALLYVCLALCLPCSMYALLYVCLALCLPCSMSALLYICLALCLSTSAHPYIGHSLLIIRHQVFRSVSADVPARLAKDTYQVFSRLRQRHFPEVF